MRFLDDAELGYRGARTPLAPGEGLALDARYRLAHLPLLVPDHPDAVARGEGYAHGRRRTALSVVLPVPAEALEASPAYRELDAALRAAPFADKVAWDLLPRRRDRLHATLCGVDDPPDAAALARLAALPTFAVELRGPFSGSLNRGRLYLRAYPERRDGNPVHAVQAALGRPSADLHLVGIWNLLDHLDPAEAAALATLIDAWWDRPVLRLRAEALWLLASRDDLCLDAEVAARIRLGG